MRARLLPWLAWLLGLAAAFHPALASGFGRLQISEGDPRMVNYVLEHTYRWVGGDELHASYWSPPIFYPARGVGAYVDTMLGAAPFYWVWRWCGASSSFAMQLWMMTCLSLTFLVGYRLLGRLSLPPACAAVGAFLFAFGVPRLANVGSPQLFPIFYAAAALVALVHVLDERERRTVPWIFAFFGALTLQLWSAFYPSFFLALVLATAFAVGLALPESRARILRVLRAHPAAIAIAVAASAALVWPMARAHLAAAGELGYRDYDEVRKGLAEWTSWLFPGRASLAYGWLTTRANFAFETAASQHSNGLGLVTLVVAAVGCFLARRRLSVRVAVLTAAVLVVLGTRIPGTDASAWRLVFEVVPGGRAVRYPARIGMFLPLVYALGVGHACRELASRGRPALAIALALACMAEQLQVLRGKDDTQYRRAIERIADEVDPECKSFFLIVDFDRSTVSEVERAPSPRTSQIAAMWAGLEAGVATVNGSYGNHPPKWAMFSVDVADEEKEAQVLRALRRWRRLNDLAEDEVCIVRVPGAWLPWLFASPRRE